MTRASRKRAERIITRRAQEGFPRVSKGILHQDGSVTPPPRERHATAWYKARGYKELDELSRDFVPFTSTTTRPADISSTWSDLANFIRRLWRLVRWGH
jgi:hypothetical protein